MEDLEHRVEELTRNLYTVMSADMVKDIVLRAVICALPHPNRATALRALEVLWLDHRQTLTDVGFDKGHSTSTAFGLVETMKTDVQRWMGLLATPDD